MLFEIINLDVDLAIDQNNIKIIKLFHRLIIISIISICLLIEMNLISIFIFGSLNTFIILFSQFYFSLKSIFLINEVFENIIYFIVFALIRIVYENLLRSFFEEKINNICLSNYYNSILKEINVGFVSIGNNKIIHSNDIINSLVNEVFQEKNDDEIKMNVVKYLQTDIELLHEKSLLFNPKSI